MPPFCEVHRMFWVYPASGGGYCPAHRAEAAEFDGLGVS